MSATPGRADRGDRARVPADTVVYAVGDIHGRLDLLEALQGCIVDDASRRTASRRVVVYLGDYVDRGPDPAGVIDRLVGAPLDGFDSVHLAGNHEDFLVRFLERPEIGPVWLANGAAATLASYGVDVAGPDSASPAALAARFAGALPASHRAFLDGLALSHVEGDYAFVHAGVQPGVALADQSRDDLLWIRRPFLESRARHEHVVVHGHTIRDAPDVRDNRIGIDTGAFATGILTAVALEGDERRFIDTGIDTVPAGVCGTGRSGMR